MRSLCLHFDGSQRSPKCEPWRSDTSPSPQPTTSRVMTWDQYGSYFGAADLELITSSVLSNRRLSSRESTESQTPNLILPFDPPRASLQHLGLSLPQPCFVIPSPVKPLDFYPRQLIVYMICILHNRMYRPWIIARLHPISLEVSTQRSASSVQCSAFSYRARGGRPFQAIQELGVLN